VETFFRTWYVPNNAVLVVCGAFDTETLIPRLEATLGRIPAGEIPRGVTTLEPEQRGERRAVLRTEASLGSVMAAWHVPETAHDDIRVLEVIDLILTAGESSRLYRRLVDTDQVALWVAAWVGTNFDPGIYQVIAQNREGIPGERVEAALYPEIDRLKTEPVTAEELAKAKRMILASFYRNLATISGRAEALGTYALFHGDWQKLFQVAKRYEAITPEDIRRVASTYLTEDNRTVVTLIPAEEEVSDAR
jgi:zinc protease